MATTAQQTKAFNAIFANLKATSKKTETLSSEKYFKNKLSIFTFLERLRAEGNFTCTLGLNKASEGGTLKVSENGRCSVWFEGNGWTNNITVSEAISKRMVELCGDENFRANYVDGGLEAMRKCYPLLTKAFVGEQKSTGITMIAV